MDAGSGWQHQWGRLQIGSDPDNIVVSVEANEKYRFEITSLKTSCLGGFV